MEIPEAMEVERKWSKNGGLSYEYSMNISDISEYISDVTFH